jgi:predicted ATP-grasp superfamily ATP-dependent carboligase
MRRQEGCAAGLDSSVPALMLKVGQYPVHSGSLGVLRTLGRCGVPVYAITEPGLPPAAVSRYLTGRFAWRATGREPPDTLIPALLAAGERIGTRSVIVAIDDEAAVLAAEHRAELAGHFLIPDVDPGLPRRLASKSGLFELCRRYDIPTPASVTPASVAEVAEFAATARFPVVIKNADPWRRRTHPVVAGTTVIESAEELVGIVGGAHADGPAAGDAAPGVILQEYLPRQHSQDWVVHLYCDADSNCPVVLTGMKLRSWPPDAGVTACGYSMANPDIAELAERFCKQIGYHGVGDLDWRLDLRDGTYRLVDFNPRPGNQFRLFETESGVDVVRALHLDMTGRKVPPAREVLGKRLIVEHVDVPARIAYGLRNVQNLRRPLAGGPGQRRIALARQHGGAARTEYAWLVADDPLPFLVMVPHALRAALAQAGSALRRWIPSARGRR